MDRGALEIPLGPTWLKRVMINSSRLSRVLLTSPQKFVNVGLWVEPRFFRSKITFHHRPTIQIQSSKSQSTVRRPELAAFRRTMLSLAQRVICQNNGHHCLGHGHKSR